MTTEELLKKIRKIEIKARGLTKQMFQGSYNSAFKGVGMSFSEVREYQIGDETRAIDWNVTAKFGEPFVKTFEEERELTVMLLIDVSNSSLIGTDSSNKRDFITELTAVLSFSAIQNNDKVGALLFSDHVEKYIPPKKGKSHVLRIINDVITHKASGKGTDINAALKYYNTAMRQKATVFLISDFIDQKDYQKLLRITAIKHDFIALYVRAKNEQILPKIGWTFIQDIETGKTKLVNTNSVKNQMRYGNYFLQMHQNFITQAQKSRIDYADLVVGENYVNKLIGLFKRR